MKLGIVSLLPPGEGQDEGIEYNRMILLPSPNPLPEGEGMLRKPLWFVGQ